MINAQRILLLSAFTIAMSVSTMAFAESAGQYLGDAGITAKVKAALISDKQLSKASAITVTTTRGEVQLSGSIDNSTQEAETVKTANQVDGVRSVKDLLTIANSDTTKIQ